MPAPAWTVAIPSLHVGGTDDDAGVEVAVGGEIRPPRRRSCRGVYLRRRQSALHGADLRRAAEGAHIHAGAIGVEDVEILTQFAYYTGDQMHHEGVAVNLG